MNLKYKTLFGFMAACFMQCCNSDQSNNRFDSDLNFLKQHIDPVVLESEDNKRLVVVAPEYQGRVMTSSSGGMSGRSYGWINYDLIQSGKLLDQFNPIGGEDRFWMGPEGGQYGVFFKEGDDFTWETWAPPAVFDRDTFTVIKKNRETVELSKEFRLVNYSNSAFDIRLERKIELLGKSFLVRDLGVVPDNEISWIAFQSRNKIINIGESAWKKETGLLSVWILGVFNPSTENTIIIPLKNADQIPAYDIINTDYYWSVPDMRYTKIDSCILFIGDGNYQCKIGIPPTYAKRVTGSYDPINKVLTIVSYTFDEEQQYFVNSLLKLQEEPYRGDVLNFYNDGIPQGATQQYGPFYEIETSSHALALNPGEHYTHLHRTYHFEGPEERLNHICKVVFGINLQSVKNAFSH